MRLQRKIGAVIYTQVGQPRERGPHGSWQERENHKALGLPLPCSLGSQKERCSSNAELSLSSLMQERCCQSERGERTLAGGP